MIIDIGRRIKGRKIFEKGIYSFCRGEEKWRRNRAKGEEEKRIRKRRKIFGERKYSFAEEKKKT